MKVFVAGATGVLGCRAVAALVREGHVVTGVVRSASKAAVVRGLGGDPVPLDLFDPEAVAAAVKGHDAVCNFATHIPASPRDYWRMSAWKTNDRLHAEASSNLVDAALATGAKHYLQHGVAFMYAGGGEEWLDEDAPMDVPPHGVAVLEAERQTARFSEGGGAGVVLRFGFFYGADAPTAVNFVRIARLGFVPMPGLAESFVPWIHTEDLATSTVAALQAPAGAYNVVDDEPTTRRTFGQILAGALGRRTVRSVPRVMTRMVPKRYRYIVRSQRVSNVRFKEATGWKPSVPTAREGWPRMIAELP